MSFFIFSAKCSTLVCQKDIKNYCYSSIWNKEDWRRRVAVLSRWGRGCWKGLRRCKLRRPRQLYQCWLPNSHSSLPWSPPQTPVSWCQSLTAWFYRSSVKVKENLISKRIYLLTDVWLKPILPFFYFIWIYLISFVIWFDLFLGYFAQCTRTSLFED